MNRTLRNLAPAGRLHGALAALLAAWVFALGLLAVAPEAHALFHGESAAHGDHDASSSHDDSGCAVSLFQQGLTPPLDYPRVGAPCERKDGLVVSAVDRVPAPGPRRLPPACGPPRVG